MSIKNWLLHKVHGLATRVDLPRNAVLRSPVLGSSGEPPPQFGRSARRAGATHAQVEPAVPHLGPYAPLIAAIRNRQTKSPASRRAFCFHQSAPDGATCPPPCAALR